LDRLAITSGPSPANGRGVSGDRHDGCPSNSERFGRYTIQGALVLLDGACGRPVRLLDSMTITALRTAVTSALAARHRSLARRGHLTVCGCGRQGAMHGRALCAGAFIREDPIRPLRDPALGPRSTPRRKLGGQVRAGASRHRSAPSARPGCGAHQHRCLRHLHASSRLLRPSRGRTVGYVRSRRWSGRSHKAVDRPSPLPAVPWWSTRWCRAPSSGSSGPRLLRA
jgi:hypothetical protein